MEIEVRTRDLRQCAGKERDTTNALRRINGEILDCKHILNSCMSSSSSPKIQKALDKAYNIIDMSIIRDISRMSETLERVASEYERTENELSGKRPSGDEIDDGGGDYNEDKAEGFVLDLLNLFRKSMGGLTDLLIAAMPGIFSAGSIGAVFAGIAENILRSHGYTSGSGTIQFSATRSSVGSTLYKNGQMHASVSTRAEVSYSASYKFVNGKLTITGYDAYISVKGEVRGGLHTGGTDLDVTAGIGVEKRISSDRNYTRSSTSTHTYAGLTTRDLDNHDDIFDDVWGYMLGYSSGLTKRLAQ